MISIALLAACSSKQKDQSQLPSDKSKKGQTSASLSLKDANDLLSKGRCFDAAQGYVQFLDKFPKDAGAWNLLGLSYLCDHKIQEAMTAFNTALEILPTYTDVHNNLGVAYMEMKNYPEAKKEFLVALQDKNYSKGGSYFNLAKLAFQEQSYEEARALAKKSMEFVPKQKDGLPQEPGPLLLYSLSLERLNRLTEAEASFRDLLRIDAGNLEGCYTLAGILIKKNQPCVAREYYLKVVDSDPVGDLGQKSIQALKSIQCSE